MPSFNIRSFGSWIASKCSDFTSHADAQFQYPLFRIVDCFILSRLWEADEQRVSISALSDRGLLQQREAQMLQPDRRFNIRSFGSWIASDSGEAVPPQDNMFQYPLFRIVDCFRLLDYPRKPPY